MDQCTQCNKCSLICPHAAVRPFLMTNQDLGKAPASFKEGSRAAIGGGVLDNFQYRIQVSPWDCTGCELCVRICPADALALKPAADVIQQEEPNWNFAITLPDHGEEIDKTTVKGSQFQKPYLEFSGACEGCGETPHVKLMTQLFPEKHCRNLSSDFRTGAVYQLTRPQHTEPCIPRRLRFGDRLVIANATGRSPTMRFEDQEHDPSSSRVSVLSFEAALPSGAAPTRPSHTPSTPRVTGFLLRNLV